MGSSKVEDNRVEYLEWRFSLKKYILMRKKQNGECDVKYENFKRCFFGMSFDVSEFTGHVFASEFEF